MLPIFVLLLVLLPLWATAQEVITNEEGRRIVVDADGSWRYFGADSTANAPYQPPQKTADENRWRIAESQKKEREMTLLLIKNRVALTDLLVAQPDSSAVFALTNREQLVQVKNTILALEIGLDNTRKRTAFLEKIAALPSETYQRKLKRWEQDHPQPNEKAVADYSPQVSKQKKAANKIANGTLFLPPGQPCVAGNRSTGPLANETRWETASTKLFSHTDVAVEQQFRKRDFIACTGFVTAVKGGVKFLHLEFAVASTKAPQVFGALPPDEFVEVLLLNGETLRLFNSLPGNGQWVAAQDAYIYRGRYGLGIREEKLLRSSEVDKLSVRWSLVQEQYNVFETDFFIRHFGCLDEMLDQEN